MTASNAAGRASATSNTVRVPIPYVPRCPGAAGTMTGTTIGQIELGMTRSRARFLYRRHSNRGKQYEDFFCLTPIGVRVGYASPKLLRHLSRREQAKLKRHGRVVLDVGSVLLARWDPCRRVDRDRFARAGH